MDSEIMLNLSGHQKEKYLIKKIMLDNNKKASQEHQLNHDHFHQQEETRAVLCAVGKTG